MSTEADSAASIVAELRAFWAFVQREYGLANARKILDSLTDAAEKRLHAELADPRNYGMAKSFFMQGQKAGFDMTTQEGLDEFMAVYKANLLLNRGPGAGLPDLGESMGGLFPPLPPLPGEPKNVHDKKKKARKAARQARKRNRK